MNWLKAKLRLWLFPEIEERFKTIERQFVTRRDEGGRIVQTLADVPVEKRKELHANLAGMSIAQRRAWAERTDGGRIV